MKNIYKYALILIACSIMGTTYATTHTVDNKEGSSAQFTDLQAAVDAAQSGDTILVAGSTTTYGSITTRKQITLIGAGYVGQSSMITRITFTNLTSNSGSSNSYISGFQVNELWLQPDYSNRVTGVNDTLSGITIERNKIQTLHFREAGDYSTKLHKDLTIKNNIFSGGTTTGIDLSPQFDFAYANSFENVNITNNVFDNKHIRSQVSVTESGGVESISGAESANGIFVRNNIWTTSTSYAFYHIIGAVVENNIFYNINIIPESNYISFDSLEYSLVFNNNITYLTEQNLTNNSWFAVGSNNSYEDPQYVDFPVDGAAFSLDHDYNLQSTSPGLGAGVNGEDLGIYGGSSPWPGPLDLKPKGPIVTEIQPVGSPSIPAGSTLEVNFKSVINN